MDFIKGFLRNPVARFMISIEVILLGIIAFSNLSIDLFPEISYPVVSIVTEYPGASPEDIEVSITRLIEKRVSRIQNVQYVSSRSREGISIVTIEFYWGTDLDAASIDVQQSLSEIQNLLPEDASNPVIYKFDPSQIAVIVLAVTGPMDEYKLRELAEDFIAPRLESLSGVASANVFGGKVKEIQVELDRSKLERMNLSVEQIAQALKSNYMDLPGGSIKSGTKEYGIRTIGRTYNIQDLEEVVVSKNNGIPIRLRDLGIVKEGYEDIREQVHVNGTRGIILGVQKQVGGNTVTVVDNVLKALPKIQKELTERVRIQVVADQSTFIRKSIKNLQNEAIMGALLAVSIILIFLGNITSTAIISLSIPLSIIATFVLLYFGKFTLNIMTLGGLALGVGRLVDDAIVVLENINRRIDLGENPEEASYRGAKEVSKPVIAATITSIIVFLPIAFIKGVAALLFVQMAYTVAFSLLASLFDSLTLVPVLTSKFLNPTKEAKKKAFSKRISENKRPWLNFIDLKYQDLLRFALINRKLVIFGVIFIFIGTLFLIPLLGSEFFPPSDEGQIRFTVRLPPGSNIDTTEKVIEKLEDIIFSEVPELKSLWTRAGTGRGRGAIFGGRFTGQHTGSGSIMLVDQAERDRSSEKIAQTLREKFRRIPGALINVFPGGIVSRVITLGADEPIDVEIVGYDLETGNLLAKQLEAILREIQGVIDIQVGREEGFLEYQLKIRPERVSSFGLTTSRIAEVIRNAIEGKESAIYVDPRTGREHTIRVRLQEKDRMSYDDIKRIPLPASGGRVVPLENVVDLSYNISPIQIERKYQQRIIHVTANTSGRDLGSIASEIEERISRMKVPEGFSVQLKGARLEQKEAFRSLIFAMSLAIMLIYMVLASQFSSLIHPFLIMFSVPMGFIGVIWALFLTGSTLSVISFIGMIMMVGIVVSNAIILTDYINRLRKEGMDLEESIIKAGRIRLRPILMTSLTTIFGLLPMALGLGEGSEAYSSLAIAVIGGLSVSTILTLIFIPTLYFVVERFIMKRGQGLINP